MDILQQNLTVSIDGAPVVYDFLEADELVHAYAISVHKCVAADTYIFTANGIQQIKDLWPDAKGVRVRPLKTHVITHEGWAETNQIFKGTVEPTITIKTRFGYSLTGSMRHPVLVYDAKTSDFVWKKMPDLKLDDWLPIQRNINAFPNEALGTAAFQINNPNNQRKHCAIPETVNEALGTFLGYLVGDGYYNDQKDGDIRFTNSDLHMHTHFQQLLAELFGLEMTLNRSTAKRKALTYYVIRRTLRDFLLYLGLDFHPANRKEVPYTILHSPKNVQAAFLKALYDCDGSASGNSTRVVLVTASAKLAEQVQMMLLNFGIVSRLSEQIIHTKKNGNQSYYRLATFGLNTVLFAQEIGFSQDHKVAQLAQLVARSKQGQGKTNVDFIPNGRSLMAELKIAFLTYLPQQTRGKKGEGFWGQLPFSTARLWHDLAQGKYQLNYTHLQKILPVAAEACSQITTTAAYQKLQTLLNKNFFFEPIVQISEGAVQVYDISVPADKSFISNGFISHNSQGAEYPCVVMPVATQHYLMLQRNLLYTAVTRAKKLVILVGTRKAIRIAVKNDKTTQRHTALDWRLQK
jgi:intein/homing endonuclease